MNFQQFCFAEEEPYNKQSYDSTYPESNDMQQEEPSDSQDGHQMPSATKLIRKKYDPIRDGDRVIRFEDNPAEYRKARKKIQNRISATKVRGRKKNQMEELETEVTNMRKQNAQLQLSNAKLQAQNTMLKERVSFLEKVVLNKGNQEADSYISTSGSNSPNHQTTYESPFEDLDDGKSVWSRISGKSNNSRASWAFMTIFTIIVGVLVMPSTNETSEAMIATKINRLPIDNPQLAATVNILHEHSQQLATIKHYFKVFVLVLYLCLMIVIVIKKLGVNNFKKLKRF